MSDRSCWIIMMIITIIRVNVRIGNEKVLSLSCVHFLSFPFSFARPSLGRTNLVAVMLLLLLLLLLLLYHHFFLSVHPSDYVNFVTFTQIHPHSLTQSLTYSVSH